MIAIAELAAEQTGIPTIQVKPQLVKAAVTGNGTAAKPFVEKLVNKLLGSTIRNGHEADAAAAAIAGLLSPNYN